MDALFHGGDVATEKGEDKSNDDAGQHKQQQHRHIRVLQEVAVKKICAVEIQKDLVLQRRLTACCDVDHMLETVVQIIVVALSVGPWTFVLVVAGCHELLVVR